MCLCSCACLCVSVMLGAGMCRCPGPLRSRRAQKKKQPKVTFFQLARWRVSSSQLGPVASDAGPDSS